MYTGIGALCWLPSIERWAATVSRLLKPGGRLFIREGHPVLWALCTPVDGIGEILMAILQAGLRLAAFEEHQSVPWDPFGAAGARDERGEYRLRERPERLPASYTLQAEEPA